LGIAAALSLTAFGAVGGGTALADEQYFPLQSYRVGPYAAGGTGFFGGFIDYLNLINIRDGGVNGVKLTWDECETQYEVERGVECYERQKSRANIAAWNPLSVGIAYAMIDRITADKVPLITVNHRRTDSTDGRVFSYVFPLLLNPYSETSGIINYLAGREGGLDKLKGKKIVVLYHGSPYGRETISIYDLLAQKYGFTVNQIEVPHPGNEQQAQWLTIRREKPNYVILRGWGVMNPVALKTAQKTGFPADTSSAMSGRIRKRMSSRRATRPKAMSPSRRKRPGRNIRCCTLLVVEVALADAVDGLHTSWSEAQSPEARSASLASM
jgi:branched-chain amino acid transport system substrate-binding protein